MKRKIPKSRRPIFAMFVVVVIVVLVLQAVNVFVQGDESDLLITGAMVLTLLGVYLGLSETIQEGGNDQEAPPAR